MTIILYRAAREADGSCKYSVLTLFLLFPRSLNLKRPIYEQTAENGHFGHSEFPWEQEKTLKLTPQILAKLETVKKAASAVALNGDNVRTLNHGLAH